MANITNKTQLDGITIYHECISPELAARACKLFKQHIPTHSRDGSTGGGINKSTKDSKDIVPKRAFPYDHEFYQVADEIEKSVMKCMVDYYRDNPGMLYGVGNFSLADYSSLPEPEYILPHILRMQHGQFQWYPAVGSAGYDVRKGGGYPANHAESFPGDTKDSRTRCLTWMMTLNTLPVTEEQYGYTVFTNQNIAVRPKAGQLVLFSPWLDCEHRGNRVNDHEKMIVTSWNTLHK